MKVRVVIDTNVIISGILSPRNYPAQILDAWLKGICFQPLISSALKTEIIEVLKRPKIMVRIANRSDLDALLPLLFAKAEMVKPKKIKAVVFKDKKDHFLFELASSGSAEAIITGDDILVRQKKIAEVELLTPKEFCERFQI